jgi:hypothetical protein
VLGGVAAAFLLAAGALVVAQPWAKPSESPTANPNLPHPDWSVARRWDEALLDAIRRVLPNPPVHARNLFHVSVAMWDAWAAYDKTATGYIVNEKASAADVAAARNAAISYAAYRVLTERYIKAVATYDVNGDGCPGYFITSQGDDKLQVLTSGPDQPAYRDIAGRRGVTAARPFTGGDILPSTAWHSDFQDVNNDGFVDLFISKGNVSAHATLPRRIRATS